MIEIEIGAISKRVNSTKRTFNSRIVSVALKNKVSAKTPSFILNKDNVISPGEDILDFNYIKWGNRYYWITNISYLNAKHVEISANLDLLATYKDSLYNIPFFCKYTNNPGLKNDELDDSRLTPDYLQPVAIDDSTVYSINNIFGDPGYLLWSRLDSTDQGCVVMQTQSYIGTRNYLMSLDMFNDWMTGMQQVGTAVTDLIAKLFGYQSWTQCINSCIWLPFNYNVFKSYDGWTSSKLYIGAIACDGSTGPNVDCYASNVLWTKNFTGLLAIPRLSDSPYFMWYNRWCTYQLMTPFGIQDINADFCALGHNYIPFSTMLEPANGQISIKLTYDSNNNFDDSTQTILGVYQGNVGVDIMSKVQMMQGWEEKIMTAIDVGLIAGGTAAAGGLASLSVGTGASSGAASSFSEATMKNTIANNELVQKGDMSTAEKLSYINDRYSNPLSSANATGHDIDQAKTASTSIGPAMINGFNKAAQCHGGVSGPNGSGLAGIVNTVQLGMLRLRRKQFTCAELNNQGQTNNQAYFNFCSKYGYPVNEQVSIYDCCYRMSPEDWDNTQVYVQGAAMVDSGYLGCNQMEANSLEQLIANGIWIE